LGVVLTPVDHRRHPGIALQVGPALAAGQRVDPQGAAGPGEPDRRDVRPVRPERRQPAGPLLAEERIHFPGTHRDHPAAPLLSHPHTSLRGLLETIMAAEKPHSGITWGHYARPPPGRCASCWTWPRSRCSRRWTPRAPCGRRYTSRGWRETGPRC